MGGRGGSSGLSNLGPRGKAKDVAQALKDTNPNYSKGKEYRVNCQRCVYAYEMNRRGYDVEAQPRIMQGVDTTANNWRNIMENQTWDKLPSRNTINKILEKMNGYGDGARAVVYVAWKGGRSAHVFIAEQQGIGTVFTDPQTGYYVDIHQYMNAAIKGKTEISRIDNLKPSDKINGCVKRR